MNSSERVSSRVCKLIKVFKFMRRCLGSCRDCCLECEHIVTCINRWKQTRFEDTYCPVRNRYSYCSEAYHVVTGEEVEL